MLNHTAVDALKARVRMLLVADLKNVCRDEQLLVSGAKSVLQGRIIQRIDQMVSHNNVTGLESMRHSLINNGSGGTLPSIKATVAPTPSTSRGLGGSAMAYTNGSASLSRNGLQTGIQFRTSPFYETSEPLARPVEMPPYPNHRNQVTINFTLTPANIERMRSDSSLRVLLYCATKTETINGTPSDISFPQQLEVKVNENEVKANFKGVKNKPGSTRPADITALVTKQPQFSNRVLITYALTQKGFTMVAMLTKKRSVDELVSRIQKGKIITKEKVLGEMQARARDPDIVVGDSIVSLKDPVSYVRIGVPCRSDVCSHHQCFDAASFLQLQEQAPTWTCPICNKTVSFEGLVVDKYFEDILQRTSSSTYQVTVEPNGRWSTGAPEKSTGQNGAQYRGSDDDSDDDLIEVVPPTVKRESMGGSINITPFSVPTPPRASPMVNAGFGSNNSTAPRTGQKRQSDYIDLTLDDDEEPAPKRPAYSTPTSLPDHSRLGRTNGYQSYPNNPASFSNRTNGPLRFQLGSGSSSGSSGGNNTTYNSLHDYSTSGASSGHEDDGLTSMFGNGSTSFPPSRSGHRPSPLSGTALAPISLDDSPPHRPPSALALEPPSNSPSVFGSTTLPRFDFESFPSPPPIPASAQNTRNANSHQRPEQQSTQRNALRALANPFGRYDP